MSHPNNHSSRPGLGSSDFYMAIGTAVACWDTASPPPNAAPITAAALERAIATGVSHLFRAITASTAPTAPAHRVEAHPQSDPQPYLPLPAISAAMAREAGIPESTAAALLSRSFVDILALPSILSAFAGLPLQVQRSAAADWAALAHAAWAAGWYPDLIGRPTYAAGELSAGWPILFEAASCAFDELITGAPGAHGSAQRRPPMAPPTASLPLPRRIGNAVSPPPRQISSAAAFRDNLQALISATPISRTAGQLIMEFVTTVAYNDAATGQVPVAAWVAMSSSTGEYLMTVHDARPQPPVPPQQRPMSAAIATQSTAVPPPSPPAPSIAAPPASQPHPQPHNGVPAAPIASPVPPASRQAPHSGHPAEPPRNHGPSAATPTTTPLPSPRQPTSRPIAGVAATAPRNAPPPHHPTQFR